MLEPFSKRPADQKLVQNAWNSASELLFFKHKIFLPSWNANCGRRNIAWRLNTCYVPSTVLCDSSTSPLGRGYFYRLGNWGSERIMVSKVKPQITGRAGIERIFWLQVQCAPSCSSSFFSPNNWEKKNKNIKQIKEELLGPFFVSCLFPRVLSSTLDVNV